MWQFKFGIALFVISNTTCMLYAAVRPFAKLSFEIYFKKLNIENIERIPLDKPVFLAVNHPTAFIEPCVLACFVEKPINFLIRGDIWKNAFYNLLMKGVHLIPIYRKRDGKDKVLNNQDTFKYCYDALANNKLILIMPEASTKEVKRLRPLAKGLARICMGSIDAYPDLDVHIVPIGANFTCAGESRNELMVKVGEPIRVLEYFEKYADNRNRAVLKLTQQVAHNMRECLIHIENKEDEELAEQLFQIARTEQKLGVFPVRSTSPRPLKIEQEIAEGINALEAEEKIILKNKGEAYYSKLEAFKIEESIYNFQKKWYHYPLLIFGFIPALIGKIFHLPPIALAHYIQKAKIKKKEFMQPVIWSVSTFGTLIYYVFWGIAGAIINSKWLWLFLICIPFLGYSSLIHSDLWENLKLEMTFDKLSATQKSMLQNLRTPLVEFIQPIIDKTLN